MSEGQRNGQIVLLMGVSGCGKTTIGQRLAEEAGWEFYDGDDFHPEVNIEKMASGLPLDDEDRWPWLEALHQHMSERSRRGLSAIYACSALKQAYRIRLLANLPRSRTVYLRGTLPLIQERLQTRQEHFMPASLLQSQFETLEEPEDALVVDVAKPPEQILEDLLRDLHVPVPGN